MPVNTLSMGLLLRSGAHAMPVAGHVQRPAHYELQSIVSVQTVLGKHAKPPANHQPAIH